MTTSPEIKGLGDLLNFAQTLFKEVTEAEQAKRAQPKNEQAEPDEEVCPGCGEAHEDIQRHAYDTITTAEGMIAERFAGLLEKQLERFFEVYKKSSKDKETQLRIRKNMLGIKSRIGQAIQKGLES